MSSLQYQLFKQENPILARIQVENGGNSSNKNRTIVIAAPEKEIKTANNDNNVFTVVNSKTDVNLFDEIFN